MSQSQAVNHSAIWSSLFTLDTVRPFTSIVKDTAHTYNPLTILNLDQKQSRLNKRHHKLATAVACIGASTPESKTVTACSAEVWFLPESEQPIITLRIAQNRMIPDYEMGKIRKLLHGVTQEIVKYSAEEWNIREGMSSFSFWS
jgi:hypothetical protein